MSKTGTSVAVPQSSALAFTPAAGKLDVWADMSAGDGTSAILAQPSPAIRTLPIEVSPSGFALQDAPRVTAVPGGYVVVWHAEGLDGSLWGVYGQRLDVSGETVRPVFRVNSTTEHDQRDPAITATPDGKTVVVWSSYGQDGDLGGIYAQLFDSRGNFIGGELPVNGVTAGHQAKPRVVFLQNGSFLVGWTTEALGSDLGAISFRLFDGAGVPLTDEVRIPGTFLSQPELVDLEPDTKGGFSLRWLLRDQMRATKALYQQQFTNQGLPSNSPLELP
jgi:hypothetical protein